MAEPDSSFTRLLTTVSTSLASAFRPFLDPLELQASQDRELRQFLGSEHLVVREHVFEQLEVVQTLSGRFPAAGPRTRAERSCTCGLAAAQRRLRQVPDPRRRRGRTPDDAKRVCPLAGFSLSVKADGAWSRSRERTRTLYKELVVDLVAGSDEALDEVGAAFSEGTARARPDPGQHLTFDKAGLRFL